MTVYEKILAHRENIVRMGDQDAAAYAFRKGYLAALDACADIARQASEEAAVPSGAACCDRDALMQKFAAVCKARDEALAAYREEQQLFREVVTAGRIAIDKKKALREELEAERYQHDRMRDMVRELIAEAEDRERLRGEVRRARNELCLACGKYHREHKGACDGCHWHNLEAIL